MLSKKTMTAFTNQTGAMAPSKSSSPIKRLALGIGFLVAQGGVHAESLDQRTMLPLTQSQRMHVLSEMRDMLNGTQAILAALAENDMAQVAQQARLLGMKKGHKAEDTLHQVLPKEFMRLGLSVHRAFDDMAADAETFRDAGYSLKQLSRTMQTCGGCHESYQISVVTDAEAASKSAIHSNH